MLDSLQREVSLRTALVTLLWPLAACSVISGLNDFGVSSGTDGDTSASSTGDGGGASGPGGSGGGGGDCVGCIILASGQGTPDSVAVDASFAYWVEKATGWAWRAPIGGGTQQQLFHMDNLARIAVNGAMIYGVNADGTSVVEAPADQEMSTPTDVAVTLGAIQLAADEMGVYWVDTTANKVQKPGAAVGTPTDLVSAGNLQGLAVSDATIYYTTSDSVSVVLTDGTSQPPILSSQTNIVRIAIDASHVYWVVTPNQIFRAPKIGGVSMGEPVGTAGEPPAAIAASDGAAYWVETGGTNPGRVMRALNEVETQLATGGEPTSIAVDAQNIYWTDTDAGAVVQLPKPAL